MSRSSNPGRGGRGRGGRSTRFGRGNGRSGRSSNGNKKPTKPTRRSVGDYIYHVGTAQNAADYELITEYLLNYIRKTYNYGDDIATAIEDQTDIDFDKSKPKLKFSKIKGKDKDDERNAENRQFEIDYKSELDTFQKKKTAYEMNTVKIFAFLWEQCSKAMKLKIEAGTDYETKVKGQPIELMKVIKLHAMSFQEHKYDMIIVTSEKFIFLTIKESSGCRIRCR